MVLAMQDQRREVANLSSCSASKVACLHLIDLLDGQKERKMGRTLVVWSRKGDQHGWLYWRGWRGPALHIGARAC
jgi:hypothetical protein